MLQVALLKASRDKLIAQVSMHMSDADRMAAESGALSQVHFKWRVAGDICMQESVQAGRWHLMRA
jgi:hypothetical protein